MRLQLARAYIDDVLVHDVTLGGPLPAAPGRLAGSGLRAANHSRPSRSSQYALSSRHGAGDQTKWLGAAVLDLAGYVTGATDQAAEDSADQLEALLELGVPHVFRFLRLGRAEEEQVTITSVSSIDMPSPAGYRRTVLWGASCVCADPRIYGAGVKSSSYDPATSLTGGGTAMPLVFPLVFATSTVTHLSAVNAGNKSTPPTFTLRGPAIDPTIDNDTTGESIYVVGNLGSSDTIAVDVAARKVFLNGAEAPDMLDQRQTRWFELRRGTNQIRARGTGMVVGQTLLAATWRDAR